MIELPNDANMLFSFVNMKLRDEYDSLTTCARTWIYRKTGCWTS